MERTFRNSENADCGAELNQENRLLDRRAALGALARGGAMAFTCGSSAVASDERQGKVTYTKYLRLGKREPISANAVNADLDRIDAEFAGRAVSPDFFKQDHDPDDTAAVQAAFDSGRTVVFTRDYYVKSVSVLGNNLPGHPEAYQSINFNGYWLRGVSTARDKPEDLDCVLEIAGKNLKLYDVKVTSNYNVNYRCGVHWHSRTAGASSQWNTIFGMKIHRFLVGIVFGSHLGETTIDCPQSENIVYDMRFLEIQNCLILNQPNGVLIVNGGIIICDPFGWTTVPQTPYKYANAYCFNVAHPDSWLAVDNCEILKVGSSDGPGFRGSSFVLTNCVIEIGGTWGYIEGRASVSLNSDGYNGDIKKNLFEIAPNSTGRLILSQIHAHRVPLAGETAPGNLIVGLDKSPEFSVVLDRGDFLGWSPARITDARRDNVTVQNTKFSYVDRGDRETGVTINDVTLNSPDGTRYKLSIDNDGRLSASRLT